MEKQRRPSIHREILDHRRRKRIGRVARTALLCVGAVGFLAAAMMAPNVLSALGEDGNKKREWYITGVLKDLVRRGLLQRVKRRNGTTGFELTNKGEEVASAYELGQLTIDKPFRWDGKWRVVMFDIKEIKKDARNELRSTLIALGFERLQKSAWVHPYPCADAISLIKRKYELGKDVLYLEVDTLENDHWLRDVFFLH